MDFMRDHWWIANVIPYFAFNIWLVHAYERDEGSFSQSDVVSKLAMYIAGLPLIGVLVIWLMCESFVDRIEKLDWEFSHGRRMLRAPRVVSTLKAIARGLTEGLIILILYALFIALTGYRPPYWTFVFEVAALWTIVELAFQLRRKGGRRD